MRRLVLTLIIASSTAPAFAASPEPEPVRARFYIFDGSSFEAGAKVPAIALMNPRKAARFERLVTLKKDLLRGLLLNVKDRALR